MATVQQSNQDEQSLGIPGNPINQPISGTGATGSAPGGPNAVGANHANTNPVSPVQQNQAPQAGSGYTDVSAYLNANPTGGTSIGNQVASNLTTGYNQVQGDINSSANAAQSAVNAGYTPSNEQLINQVASNPTAAAANPSQTSAFQAQLNDTYTGPTSWADTSANGGYGTLQGEVNTAQQNANIQTPGMANVLTQQVEQQLNPGQTGQGINALDTLLLTSNPNAVNTVQQAAAPYAGLTNYLNTQNTNIGNDITAGQNNAAQASQNALNAFTGNTGTLTGLNQAINTETQNTLAQDTAEQQQLKTDLANLETPGAIANQALGIQNYNVGTLSPQDLAALGLTQAQGTALQQALQNAGTSQYETAPNFGASSATAAEDLGSYLQQQNPNTVVNAGTVATPQQYQEMAAINQLLGSQAPTQTEAINPLNAAEAGTINPAQLNNFNYQGALTGATNFATQAQQAAQAQANGLSAAALAQHNASKGGLLNKIENAASLINPVTYADTVATNNGVNKIKNSLAHGGEVKDVNEYLDKVKSHG
jgi:hypothetical protein